MILEQHYDDEVLIGFLNDEPAARRDPHLANCRPCAETLNTLRSMSDVLEAEAVWDERELDETPRGETMEFLRAKQREVVAEGALRALLASPREGWGAVVEAHPEWRTKMFAARMVDEAERCLATTPANSLELSRLAIAIARAIPDAAVTHVSALRTRGFALYYTGNHREALETTETAEAVVAAERVPDLDAARIVLLRALIVCDFGAHEESRHLAQRAAATFAEHKDWRRYVSARRAEGIALYHLRRFSAALDVYESVHQLCESVDSTNVPGLLQNIALCHRELGAFDTAMSFFLRSNDSYQRLGQVAALAKNRWYIGRVLLLQGKYEEALKVLTDVRKACEESLMLHDVALVTIDMAQALSVIGSPSRVIELCRTATEYFASAGLAGSEGALTALGLIREAAASGRLTQELIAEARFRAERKPKLQFAYALSDGLSK